MALKVTLGEATTKGEEKFPCFVKTHYGSIIELYKHPKEDGKFIGIHRSGQHKGNIVLDFCICDVTYYNEPITLQNI